MATGIIDELIEVFSEEYQPEPEPTVDDEKEHKDYYGNIVPSDFSYEEIKDIIKSDRYEYIAMLDQFMDFGEIKSKIAKNRELFQIKLKAMLSQAKEDCCNPNYRNRGG